ncbi:unnamed protein product [Brassicogethes aeneus]|uniref:Kinesin motor domain-containing protein n=1 Tax=Brassicogethes aeneus TaxID=1431903 RepID=A0A9P0FDV1_BRAAE|nr:unnamed protein product [Brassicogethes aeneus]
MSIDATSVKVAVRIRPLADYEISKGCKTIIDVIPENEQIIVNNTKPFTFNYVFDAQSTQEEFYNCCVKDTIENLFQGYNMTILAYGQTGSGKTYSMGTAYKGEGDTGVIPRAISDIFNHIQDNFAIDFTVQVSFIELYQEVLYDLLSGKPRDQCVLDIREDTQKGIHIPNMTEIQVTSANEVLEILSRGSAGRATASTNMNSQSSRSHAILTVTITMQSKDDPANIKTAKLHLVDLAGSERPKKTGAVGNTFKEGVNINKGLMVLGNVISCLGDEKNKSTFVPYRDSNLTRLLKDSLGGNSITLMIACVSPADYNHDETLSTLRYADRAKKIKNKPVVNQDSKVAEINDLKKTIQNLRLQIVAQGGPVICPAEIELLKRKNMELEHKIKELNLQLSASLVDKTGVLEKNLILQAAVEKLSAKHKELGVDFDLTVLNITDALENNDAELIKKNVEKLNAIQNRFMEIDQDHKLLDSEIKNHDQTFVKQLFSSSNENLNESGTEHQNAHTHKQLALNTELQEVMKQLAMKETLAEKLISNAQHMVDYQSMQENELKMAALQKEKDELVQLLQLKNNAHGNSTAADQRRKRIKDLEGQIADLNRKVSDQARLIKIRDKDEQRINKLNSEITAMKQVKVKLIRNMREESDKFRAWKQVRERELAKLKHEDRKKANEIVKMKLMNSKQQNVLKRKVEEATALNKRLQQSLQVRKQAQESKTKGGKNGNWLKQEFDVFMNLTEAKVAVACLLEDRAQLQEQLTGLKENEEKEEARCLEEEIECRSAQIQDFQQRILESDEEAKAKARFDNIQTMAEAKAIAKFLWDQSADIKRQSVQNRFKITEMQEGLHQVREHKKMYEANLKSLDEKYGNQMSELEEYYEEKVAYLLGQLRGVKRGDVEGEDSDAEKRCGILEEQNENWRARFEQLEEEMKSQKRKNLELQSVIDKIKETGDRTYQANLLPMTPNLLEVPPRNLAVRTIIDDEQENFLNSSIDDIMEDDPNDPDWRKTPLGKRVVQEKKRLTSYIHKLNFDEDSSEERASLKRSSAGGCTCKTNCNARCGCRRMNRSCGDSCKCNAEMCSNIPSDSDKAAVETAENENFKKPKMMVGKKAL